MRTPPRRPSARFARRFALLACGATLGALPAGCGGEATVVGEGGGGSPRYVAPNPAAPAAPVRTNAATNTTPAAPAARADGGGMRRTDTARTETARTDARRTDRTDAPAPRGGERADADQVAARRAVRDRRVRLGLPASPSPDEDRTAAVQLLGTDGPLPGLAGLARDALAAAFPSQIAPLLVAGDAPGAPPVVLLAEAPDLTAVADAAPFLSPAEPVAGADAIDYDLARTVAVKIDAAAVLSDWLSEANAPTPAATLTLRAPAPADAAPNAAGSFETIAEGMRRAAFALGPDGDPDTPDQRAGGWAALVRTVPDERPAPANPSDDAAAPPAAAALIVAGPVADPIAWLAAARERLSAATFAPTAGVSDENAEPVAAAAVTVAADAALAQAEPDDLDPPADGDAAGWAFALTARREALDAGAISSNPFARGGGVSADSAPDPGEAPRAWAVRVLASGSPDAGTEAARFLAALAPPPGTDATGPEGETGTDGGPAEAVASSTSEDPPAGAGPGDDAVRAALLASLAGEPGTFSEMTGAAAAARLSALLRWSDTRREYAEAGEAVSADGIVGSEILAAVLDRVTEDPAAAAALPPMAAVEGAGERIMEALKQPDAPGEAAAIALLESKDKEVRRSATVLLSEIGTLEAAASLAEAAKGEYDKTLAKEMRKARIPILERARQ